MHNKCEIEDNRPNGGNTDTEKVKKSDLTSCLQKVIHIFSQKIKEKEKNPHRKVLVIYCAYV